MVNQTEKLFTVAGTATDVNGVTKARFANDLVSRFKILNKAKCTNIELIELPVPMTKIEALQHLITLENSTVDAEAVASKLHDKTYADKPKRDITVEGLLAVIGSRPKIAQSTEDAVAA